MLPIIKEVLEAKHYKYIYNSIISSHNHFQNFPIHVYNFHNFSRFFPDFLKIFKEFIKYFLTIYSNNLKGNNINKFKTS